MLYEESVGERTLCGLVGQGPLRDLRFTGEQGSLYSGKAGAGSQHKQTSCWKSGSHVETADRQDQAGPGGSPVARREPASWEAVGIV